MFCGTNAKFDTFMGTKTLNSSEGVDFNFAVDKDIAKGLDEVMSVYLNLENPVYAYSDIDLVTDTYEDYFESENQDAIRNAVFSVKDKLEEKGYTFYSEVYDFLGYLAERKQTQEILDGLLDLGGYIEEDYDSEVLYNDIRKAEMEAFGIDGYVTRNYNGSEKAVYIAFSPNQIKSVDNRGTFDINNPNIYYQTAAAYYPNKVIVDEGIVDLTDAFDSVPTIKEVEKFVERIVKEGGEYFTKTPNKKIKLPKGRYRKGHLAHSNKWEDMSFDEKQRHNMYVEAYRELIENSVYSKAKLNTERDNKHKKNVNKYHYFTVKVRIGNDVYNVVLDTEEFDGDRLTKPQITSLYNVKEVSPSKKNSTKAGFENNGKTSNRVTISESDENINSDGKLYQKAYVSMKGELVGDYLDIDWFEMMGESSMLHGWGNYLLKDREINKIRYFL